MTNTTTPHLRCPRAPAAARACSALLRQLRVGTLDVQLPDGTHGPFRQRAASRRPRCACTTGASARPALQSGDIGFAECFIDGELVTAPTWSRCSNC